MIGQITPDPADRIFLRSISELDSDRLRDGPTPPRYLFVFCNSANMFQHMLSQIMGDQIERNTDMGEHGRAVGIIHPTYD